MEAHTFKSNSNGFYNYYFLAIILMIVGILYASKDMGELLYHLAIFIFPVAVILILPFTIQTFYTIKAGKIIKHSRRSKNESTSFIINILDIRKAKLIQKRDQNIGIKLYDVSDRIPMATIYVKEVDTLLKLLQEKNAAIEIV